MNELWKTTGVYQPYLPLAFSPSLTESRRINREYLTSVVQWTNDSRQHLTPRTQSHYIVSNITVKISYFEQQIFSFKILYKSKYSFIYAHPGSENILLLHFELQLEISKIYLKRKCLGGQADQ